MKIHASHSSLIVSFHLIQAAVCNSGVQQQRTAVPEGQTGCASLWVCGLSTEDGC